MKTPAAILLLVCALSVTGCSSGIQRVSPEKFKSLYATTPYMATMHTTDYIGHTQDRAYIEDSWMRLVRKTWKSTVYYVYLEELDPAFRNELLNAKQKQPPTWVNPPNPAMPIPELFKYKPDEAEKKPAFPENPTTIKY